MSDSKPIDIPVLALGPRGDDMTGRAILRQLEELLAALVERDEPGSIDLRSLPFGPEDRQLLEEALGEGEVEAEVESMGPSRVRETGIPGIWWVTHYGSDQQPLAELLEVTYCPEILITPSDAAKEGLSALRARLFESDHMGR